MFSTTPSNVTVSTAPGAANAHRHLRDPYGDRQDRNARSCVLAGVWVGVPDRRLTRVLHRDGQCTVHGNNIVQRHRQRNACDSAAAGPGPSGPGPSGPGPSDEISLSPARLADTRPGQSTVDSLFAGEGIRDAGSTLELTVAGRGALHSARLRSFSTSPPLTRFEQVSSPSTPAARPGRRRRI